MPRNLAPMSEFPSVSFSGDHEGLFSAEEVKSLMRAECARATRYKYPVQVMRIAVDRLDQLGDLYGYESRDEILAQITGVIRKNTRESDFLGYKVGGTFHALFPHTGGGAGPALATRLLQDTAKLLFNEGSAQVQVTLSIGITSREVGDEVLFEELTEEVAAAIELALARGGNRFEVYVAPPSILDHLPEKGADSGELGKQLSGMLDQRLESFFKSMGEARPDFGGRDREVMALAVEKMEAAHQEMREMHASQVSKLERRLNKVSSSLADTEGELRRGFASGQIDTGVASIYRTVQGLVDVEDDAGLKKEMMSKIFEANLEIRSKPSE